MLAARPSGCATAMFGADPQCSGRRTTRSIAPQVREALDRRGIRETSVNKDGYRVEDGSDDAAVVRWGRGEPFRGAQISRRGDDLARCGRALEGAGFTV